MSANDVDFAARLRRAREGDAGAWAELYHEVAPLVLGYLRAQRLPDPEDVAGEVMLELVRDLDRFSGGADGFRSWTLAIAHHRLLDARRRIARRPARQTTSDVVEPPAAGDDPEAEALAAIGFGALEPALAALTEEQRTVLLLRVIGDLSIAEVARITDRRPGAVKQLQRRATAALRRHLDHPPSPEVANDSGGRPTTVSVERTGRDVATSGDASPTRWTN